MNDAIQVGDVPYRTGSLKLNEDLKLLGGSILVSDSVNKTPVLFVNNDDGHADHPDMINVVLLVEETLNSTLFLSRK